MFPWLHFHPTPSCVLCTYVGLELEFVSRTEYGTNAVHIVTNLVSFLSVGSVGSDRALGSGTPSCCMHYSTWSVLVYKIDQYFVSVFTINTTQNTVTLLY